MSLKRHTILIPCLCVMGVAACSSDSPTGGTAVAHVSWDVGHVKLEADSFCIDVGGLQYLAEVAGLTMGGDAGDTAYCTLELEWTEHAKDMRLYIYFMADATHWWSDEIRTYDGAPSSDGTRWVYYIGEFFKSPKGGTFTGTVTITSTYSDNGVSATLHFKNLRLTAL